MEKVTLTLNEQTRALLRATGNASSYVRKVTDQRQMEWVSALAWLEKNGWTTSRITREMPSPGEPLLVVGETQAHALDRLDAEAIAAVEADRRDFFACDCPSPKEDGSCPGHSVK